MAGLSIITVNYNDVAGLRRTVESVLGQSDKDFEYVVIDGGSDDGSRELLEQTGGIDFWVSEKDAGIYEAMNKGIAKASGDYLLFINSGDRLFEVDTVRHVRPHLGSADIVYGNLKIEGANDSWDGFMPDVIDLRQMMRDTLWHPVSFVRSDLFRRYGPYDTSYEICGDYDFFFNVIVDKHVSSRHIDQFIAVFDLTGLSSRPENGAKVDAEKRRSQRAWLAEEEIETFWAAERRRQMKTRIRGAVLRLPRRIVGTGRAVVGKLAAR